MIKLFLFLFVVLPIVFVLGVFTILHRFKQRIETIQRQFMDGMGNGNRTDGRRRSNGSRQGSPTIYDTRQAECQRKIFTEDEGEYVDYKDVE